MTEIQKLILSVCFGALVDFFADNLIRLICIAASKIREKCRKRKEEKKTATKAE